MKTKEAMLAAGLLAALVLTACVSGARADTQVTVGVGHMCCPSCQKSAKASLTAVASNVAIDGNDITMTLKEADLLPALDALRKGGFPANHLSIGSSAATIAVAHLCCGKCNTGLQKAMTEAKLEALDTDGMKIGDGAIVVKSKDGMKLDLIPVLAAMEKGGFSATKITLSAASASAPRRAVRTALR